MLAQHQTLEGISSLVGKHKGLRLHIVLWDLEKCSLEEAKTTLKKVQKDYGLSDIFIVNDGYPRTFRAWCFSIVPLRLFLRILIDTQYIDYSFLYYTFRRQKATIRTSRKKDRLNQKVVACLKSYHMPIPTNFQKVTYDTGLVKRGRTILIGDSEPRMKPLGNRERIYKSITGENNDR
jgi:hypothetical protein